MLADQKMAGVRAIEGVGEIVDDATVILKALSFYLEELAEQTRPGGIAGCALTHSWVDSSSRLLGIALSMLIRSQKDMDRVIKVISA